MRARSHALGHLARVDRSRQSRAPPAPADCRRPEPRGGAGSSDPSPALRILRAPDEVPQPDLRQRPRGHRTLPRGSGRRRSATRERCAALLDAALDLLLAGHAGGDLGDRLEPRLTDRLVALHAGAVGAVLHTLERGGQALDALDQPLAAHQAHLALLAGLDVIGLVPHAVGRGGDLLQRDLPAELPQAGPPPPPPPP